MNEITDRLKNRIEATVPALGQENVFDLIAAACTGCCQVSNSGNGGCPPKPEKVSE